MPGRSPGDAPAVLFVCQDNSARSVMAEGFLGRMVGDGIRVRSAGVTRGDVHPLVRDLMQEVGVDLGETRARAVADIVDETFDVVITLCEVAHEYCSTSTEAGDDPSKPSPKRPVYSGIPILVHWSVEDPMTGDGGEAALGARIERARDEIRRLVEDLVGGGYLEGLVTQHRRWGSLVDTLPDGILAHDLNRRIFLFNEAAERIMGQSRDDVLGRDCHDVFAPDGLCGSQCSFCTGCKVDLDGDTTLHYEIDMTTPRGDDRRLRMTVSPTEMEPGRAWGVLAVIEDLTEISELRRRTRDESSFHGMIGRSAPMRGVFETIRQIRTSDYPVLVTGESGTGKELVAGAIHEESRRKAGPFVPINCGALPDNILESELFGHVRGAFTGAIRDKKGRFELAEGGTIFLDEVGELSSTFQVKLLRVLQEKRFEMVGGERTIEVDVRVVAATNRDLRSMVAEGRFREDLYYRLCVVPIDLPPLRERMGDIPPLVESTLQRVRDDTGSEVTGVSDEALSLMMSYSWPGNVRELINALQYASVQATGDRILAQHLPAEIRMGLSGSPPPAIRASPPTGRAGRRSKLDAESVAGALERAGGNKVRAAKILGVGRATLYRFLKDHPDR